MGLVYRQVAVSVAMDTLRVRRIGSRLNPRQRAAAKDHTAIRKSTSA